MTSSIKIRPLEWGTNGTIWFQKSLFPRYEIVPGYNKVRLLYGQRIVGSPLASVEAAKASAQSDYEARILSAIIKPSDLSPFRQAQYDAYGTALSVPCLQEPVGSAVPVGINWEDADDPVVKLFVRFDVEGYVNEYELCCDEGYYSPNEQEKTLLIDAIYGAISNLHEALRKITTEGDKHNV